MTPSKHVNSYLLMLDFLRGANVQKTKKTRKNIIEIFKNIEFQTDIGTSLKEVNFSGVIYDLTNGRFRCVF